jgi:diguanylate cyclase
MEDTIEASSEAFRVAVPLMSRRGSGCTPTSYAIWYEYVRGTNLALREEIDAILKSAPKLTTQQTTDLYQQYIVDKAERALGRTKIEILDLIGRLNAKLADAGEGTSVFSEQLQIFGSKLSTSETLEEMAASVGTMSSEVSMIEDKMAQVRKDLTRSQADVETLTLELQRAREEALMDTLSQLKNRRAYEIGLEKFFESSRSANSPLSVILLDIDFFKRINDKHGHLVGDQVIRAIAQAIQSNVKGKDLVARYGGEEFVVLLPDTPLMGALALAKHLLEVIERLKIKKVNSTETISAITVSAGVSQLKNGEGTTEFIDRADRGLYQAKASGRNCIFIGTSFGKLTRTNETNETNQTNETRPKQTATNTLSNSTLLQGV